ncbi:hypothetical protein CCAX7_35400 [Capsulimonas corticalis]|uniref:Transposase n=1 Tax=Capsulimonas corticalis TaxID=2219043 RepID=A0A402D7B6_9BACT|nr:helix-turn-helix domain-containing protein [Capsulimonas corticalis]BDI29119.1 hypothetical protein CCAX7_11700 [Capsulimonas corticalis]BDI29826.1 hypothetical protein CCAX7_18770 [Capsulimonas corticalis]BDI31222.1 hypothetical protein CCAX7_32730 [Capsulimonas corticalis]BDI31489.1 hypothetical protein CCAX7_35400 [Capsulimonas corticalis]
MYLKLRDLTAEERTTLDRIARSRTEAVRLVERAKMILAINEGQSGPEIARQFGCDADKVYRWVHRFYDQGLDGLQDKRRSGRPRIYTPDQYAEVIGTALTSPQELHLPFASWTLDRLAAYLKEQKNIAMGRNRIDQILIAEGLLLIAEGLRWQTQESWFSVKTDPDFKAKRGRSKHSTSKSLKMPLSSV